MRAEQVVGAAALIFGAITPHMTTAFIGAPINVIVGCACGAYASFSFGYPVTDRRQMWRIFFACIIMGAAFTGLLAYAVLLWKDKVIPDGAQAAIGTIVSCVTRFWLPSLAEKLRKGSWTKWIPFLGNQRRDAPTVFPPEEKQ